MICLKIRTFVVSATTIGILTGFILSLWFAWKFVPLWYQQQRREVFIVPRLSCDLLENSYLCGISNNQSNIEAELSTVVICLKIRTFVVSATTRRVEFNLLTLLWFAWKFVPLWYQQQLSFSFKLINNCCDLLENSYLCGISNNIYSILPEMYLLWFAWKFVPLWYQQQPGSSRPYRMCGCDLLENSYLCGISNNNNLYLLGEFIVVICLKIRTFVVSATTAYIVQENGVSCDLLENSYLCGISNNTIFYSKYLHTVVICLKIRTFVVSATTWSVSIHWWSGCDLLENSYLCGISNNRTLYGSSFTHVVICLKIRTFVVSATTITSLKDALPLLWFAWKFVPLWYQQQHFDKSTPFDTVVICLKIRTFVVSATTSSAIVTDSICCDLLENSYLCGISNNSIFMRFTMSRLWFAWKFVPLWYQQQLRVPAVGKRISCDLLENSYLCGISNNLSYMISIVPLVVICLKIRTFVVSATTYLHSAHTLYRLWFAWKFVPLWYQQQLILLFNVCVACCDLLENSYLCGISNNPTY